MKENNKQTMEHMTGEGSGASMFARPNPARAEELNALVQRLNRDTHRVYIMIRFRNLIRELAYGEVYDEDLRAAYDQLQLKEEPQMARHLLLFIKDQAKAYQKAGLEPPRREKEDVGSGE